MYQLYKSVANGLSKQAQETTEIKVNTDNFNFSYINRTFTIDSTTGTTFLASSMFPYIDLFGYNIFLGDVDVYNCPSGLSFKYENTIGGSSVTKTETNGIIKFQEILLNKLEVVSGTSGTLTIHIKGFALKEVVTGS